MKLNVLLPAATVLFVIWLVQLLHSFVEAHKRQPRKLTEYVSAILKFVAKAAGVIILVGGAALAYSLGWWDAVDAVALMVILVVLSAGRFLQSVTANLQSIEERLDSIEHLLEERR